MNRTSIPVVYRPEMTASTASFSPSAGKPAAVVEDWLCHGLPITLVRPQPLPRVVLSRTHSPDYVRAVFDGSMVNGFGNTDPAVADSLLYTTGAMALATQIAMASGIACAPVSGFHHAGWAWGGGYCTFNGLMVAIEQARFARNEETISAGILDLDYHYGNGTQDIIDRGLGGHTEVIHFTAGRRHTERSTAEDMLRRLPSIVENMAKRCDVVLYQAGADQHIDDPLGGLLTTEQMRRRDRIVFETFAEHSRPGNGLVWNLAGGYQIEPDGSIPKVLELHRITMEECAKVFVGGAA